MIDNKGEKISWVNRQYGKWNAILAVSETEKYVLYQNHSKMFPETLEEWVEATRKAITSKNFIPVRLDLDVTNFCSDSCVMCFSRDLQKMALSFSKVKKIIDEFRTLGGKSIRLTGGGDCLNHPRIIEIIEHLAKCKMTITVQTNGDLLIDQKVRDTIACHVHHLRISVNSGDNLSRQQVHRPIRTSFNYENLLESISDIINRATLYKRKNLLFLGATFIILPENYKTINKFVDDMQKIGVNWIAVRKNVYREVYRQFPNIIPYVENVLDKLPEYDNFIVERQYGVSFSPQRDFNICWISRLRPIILADSSLQLCCLARNQLLPEARVGFLEDIEGPIMRLIKNNGERIETFYNKVPINCKICIDQDNNISLSHIASLLKTNPAIRFYKANVFNSKNPYFIKDFNGIYQVGLKSDAFIQFNIRKIVKV